MTTKTRKPEEKQRVAGQHPNPIPSDASPQTTGKPAPPIVGIGTSAGGLEALELFLGHVPPNCGMAFVVVQHLSPDHAGNLPELLQRSTAMKVLQAQDAMKVEPDRVYVIPPNKDLSIHQRTLHLQAPAEKHGLRLPIDHFFRSLAEDGAEQSIGVILSGMGSDGTAGFSAIKEQGGLTLVQEPASAKFDSMPKSAIDAGLVDIVAPAEDLPGRIADLIHFAPPRQGGGQGRQRGEASIFDKIAAILKAKTRHDFSAYKPSSVYRRVERRMAIHKIDSLADYALFLQKNAQEVDLLFKELLIGVTSFFRDPAMWEELKNDALPKILAAYPEGGTLRAWSCGCSTGEEAYSLAMLFREALDQLEHSERYHLQIFATDLDSDAIDKARKGLYPPAIEANVSPRRLQRFFREEHGKYRICQDIREQVTFAQQNAIMDPPFTKLDIVVCRNLLIYFSADLQRQLLSLFHYSLKPGGLLFLGSAETVGSQSELFSAATIRSKLYWRSNAVFQNGALTFPTSITSRYPAASHQESLMLKMPDDLQLQADKLIMKHFSAPAVLVNRQGDIVYISGRTGKYLEPAAGKANLNVFAMVRDDLRYKLESAFGKALQQSEPVTVRGALVEDLGTHQAVDVTLMKLEAPESLQGMVLIAFKDVAPPPKPRRRGRGQQSANKELEGLEQELLQTREELRTTREEMQTAHEELKSANEELQSTNEELQSTNEELTTSKEEMQSMNEELQSVNAEQSARLEEFMQIHNDMENLLNSTEIVTIFLDNQLRVRRFTTGANRLFKLIPNDVGRPLTDIVSNLNYPQLYEHVQNVLRKLISVEHHVSSSDGSWFLVRIMPYRTTDKMINGVVITFNDITTTKTTEDELRNEIARLRAQGVG